MFPAKNNIKIIAQILIVFIMTAVSTLSDAGRKRDKVCDKQSFTKPFDPPKRSWLDFDSKIESPDMAIWRERMQAAGMEFSLLYHHPDKCPEGFLSPLLYELLKDFDYCATRWVWSHESEINSKGEWKVRIKKSRDLCGELEDAVDIFYQNTLPDLLSLMLHYVFSYPEKLSEENRKFINTWLLWINEQILPKGMEIDWRSRYRELWDASKKWKKPDKYHSLSMKRTKPEIKSCISTHFSTQKEKVFKHLHASSLDPELDMVMIWDLPFHHYGTKRVYYCKDPLIGFYSFGLFKIFLCDTAFSKPWERTLAVAWYQWFMAECRAKKRPPTITNDEMKWFHRVYSDSLPEVSDLDTPIPSDDMMVTGARLAGQEGHQCRNLEGDDIHEKDEKDEQSDENEVVDSGAPPPQSMPEADELKKVDIWSPPRSTWLDLRTSLSLKERAQWEERVKECGIKDTKILFNPPSPVCPRWFKSEILYELLYQFYRCSKLWVINHNDEIDPSGIWKQEQSNEQLLAHIGAIEDYMCTYYDNNMADVLSYLLNSIFSPPLLLDEVTRSYTNLWLSWINTRILPAGVRFNWRDRYCELAKASWGWGLKEGASSSYDSALREADWSRKTEYSGYNALTQIRTTVVPGEGAKGSRDALEDFRRCITDHLNEHYTDDAPSITDSLDCSQYDQSTGLWMITRSLFRQFRDSESKRESYCNDPLFIAYRRALFKITMCDPLYDTKIRLIAVCLRQWYLGEFRYVVKKKLRGDGWSWYKPTMDFVFPDIPEDAQAIPIPYEPDVSSQPLLAANDEEPMEHSSSTVVSDSGQTMKQPELMRQFPDAGDTLDVTPSAVFICDSPTETNSRRKRSRSGSPELGPKYPRQTGSDGEEDVWGYRGSSPERRMQTVDVEPQTPSAPHYMPGMALGELPSVM
ncbi:hypothetical protein [Spongorhabdus nitratireducens]